MGGIYGDFAQGMSEIWQAKRDRPLTPAQRDRLCEQIERARAKVGAARREAQERAAKRAAEMWSKAKPINKHDYLLQKGVAAHGVREWTGRIVVPMCIGETLHSLQFIGADGEKRYLLEGRKGGCYHAIGEPNGVICVCEGYATGASVHEATGHAVAVAFDAGNLEAVGRELRAKYPNARFIFCADDDARTRGNPGVTKATEAARAVGGLLAVPHFGADRPDGATDFNDLAQHSGREAVERAIANARPPDVSARQRAAPSATAGDLTGHEWPEPQPLTVAEDSKPYPIEALPDGVREAVSEVVGFVQCPASLAACSALSALSVAGQALADVKRGSVGRPD
jgi:putative DNA primase/helicase